MTATTLKQNLSYYLERSKEEDVFITKNGKIIAKLSNPYKDKINTAKSLRGCIKLDLSEETVKEERTSQL